MAQATVARAVDLDVERGPDWLLVRPRNLAARTLSADHLAEQVWSLFEQHFAHRLVLELDDVDCLDAELVGELIRLEARIHAHDGMMRICGLSAGNQQLLAERDSAARLHFFGNREEAVMGSARPHHPR